MSPDSKQNSGLVYSQKELGEKAVLSPGKKLQKGSRGFGWEHPIVPVGSLHHGKVQPKWAKLGAPLNMGPKAEGVLLKEDSLEGGYNQQKGKPSTGREGLR